LKAGLCRAGVGVADRMRISGCEDSAASHGAMLCCSLTYEGSPFVVWFVSQFILLSRFFRGYERLDGPWVAIAAGSLATIWRRLVPSGWRHLYRARFSQHPGMRCWP
jgi:hypothetical protein